MQPALRKTVDYGVFTLLDAINIIYSKRSRDIFKSYLRNTWIPINIYAYGDYKKKKFGLIKAEIVNASKYNNIM